MGRIYAIALNAYREAIRDRVLLGVLGLAAASLLVGSSIAWLSIAEPLRILVDHGVVTLSWLANLVAIFLGASFLYKEIELRTLYVILAKPVSRWEFVLGKYLGIVATAVVFVALTAAMLLALLDLQAAEGAAPAGARMAWISDRVAASRGARLGLLAGAGVVLALLGRGFARARSVARARAALGAAGGVLGALALLAVAATLAATVAAQETRYVLMAAALVAGEVAITAAVAVFFSSFSTPFVTGMLTVGAFLVGRSAGAMLELRGRQVPAELRTLLRGIATVVPNLQLYVPSRAALLADAPGIRAPVFVANALLYGALYASLLVAAAAWIFRRRDLT